MRLGRSLFLFAALSLPVAAMASTITVGNPVPGGTVIDSCTGCDYIVNQAFSSANYTVTNYTFSAGGAGDITPLLFTRTNAGGNATFTLVGIGTSRSVAGSGISSFDFGLTSGTDVTATNTYFGFYSTAPVTLFDYTTSTSGTFFAYPGLNAIGATTTSDFASGFHHDQLGFLNDRAYAVTAVAATPEPSSIALLGTGLLGVAGTIRRRLKR